MTTWDAPAHAAVTGPEEVRIVTRRCDGSLRRPRIIWIVPVDDRVFIRSANGRGADWFRRALATGEGQILAGGATYEIAFGEAADADLPDVDEGYRRKYGRRYASIVEDLLDAGPRDATLEIRPA